jgi:hypothetical protein
MNPHVQEFVPAGMVTVRPESSVGGDSDRTITQERYNRSLQTGTRATRPPSPEQRASAPTFTSISFGARHPTTTTTDTMSDNSKTPRNKRLSNGPGASPADKFPEDSPTRVRGPPRFPAAMRRQQGPQQQAALRVEDTITWPSLGEATRLTRNQRRRNNRVARDSSTSTSGSETAMAQERRVSQQPDASALSPEQQNRVEAEVEAFRQRLLQQHTPTRRMSVPERSPFQPRPAPYSPFQPGLAQQSSSQLFPRQSAQQQVHASRPEMAATRPPFVAQTPVGHVAAQQQQQLTTQQQQQASPFRAAGPALNQAYNFDRLSASQQAQREATVAQLHSAFFEPSTYGPTTSAANTGYQIYGAYPGPYADQVSLRGQNAPTEPSATMRRFSQPTTPGLNPSAQGFHPRPEASTIASAPRERVNPAYLPVFDTGTEGRSTHTDAPAPHEQINPAYLPVYNTGTEGRSTQTKTPARGQISTTYLPGFGTGTEGGSTHTDAPASHGQVNPAYLPVFDTSAEGRSVHTGAPAPRGQINPAYLPVFDTSAGDSTHAGAPAPQGQINPVHFPVFNTNAGRSTDTGTSATETSTTEPSFTPADYETSPPPSPSASMLGIVDQHTSDSLRPDNRPLTLSQQTGTHYGIEIGAIGVSSLGTSDRTLWMPSPWNRPSQQSDSCVRRPHEYESWRGWEWATEKGRGKDDDKK